MLQVNYSNSFDERLTHVSLSDINLQHVQSISGVLWWPFSQSLPVIAELVWDLKYFAVEIKPSGSLLYFLFPNDIYGLAVHQGL